MVDGPLETPLIVALDEADTYRLRGHHNVWKHIRSMLVWKPLPRENNTDTMSL
jgi:hypothetical protein